MTYSLTDVYYRYNLETEAHDDKPELHEHKITEVRQNGYAELTNLHTKKVMVVWPQKLQEEFGKTELEAKLIFVKESIKQIEYYKDKISLYHKHILEVFQ